MEKQKLIELLEKKGYKISLAEEIKSTIQMQKGLLKKKESLTDFDEPLLFLRRGNGNKVETFHKATQGMFVFEHSNGKNRFIELRPEDQLTFPYGEKKIRVYFADENRPYTGWENPVVDGESTSIGIEKVRATDLKYQSKMEELKNKGKLTWVWIVIGLAIALAIGAFAYNTWIVPSQIQKAQALANIPQVGWILLTTKIKQKFKKNKNIELQ